MTPVGSSLQWRRLCRAAAVEQDPDRLRGIVQKINAKLGMRQRMLRGTGVNSPETMFPNLSHREFHRQIPAVPYFSLVAYGRLLAET
jgi:hypothetical protein